jgi:hypothetical protein
MGWSLRHEWTHEPLEHRIAQARTEAQDNWAEELAAGAGVEPEALHIPRALRSATPTGLAAPATCGVPDGPGARSRSLGCSACDRPTFHAGLCATCQEDGPPCTDCGRGASTFTECSWLCDSCDDQRANAVRSRSHKET